MLVQQRVDLRCASHTATRARVDLGTAGQSASYVNAVTEAFELENVCKCRASRDYTQKGDPIAGAVSVILLVS